MPRSAPRLDRRVCHAAFNSGISNARQSPKSRAAFGSSSAGSLSRLRPGLPARSDRRNNSREGTLSLPAAAAIAASLPGSTFLDI
jgi:hypothetical protein